MILLLVMMFTTTAMLRPRTEPNAQYHAPPLDHHLTHNNLVMTLNHTDSQVPSIRITITNYHFSTKVSVLTWDSPFDEEAVALGVFSVSERESGKHVPSLGVQMDRLLPPKQADFLELLPRHAVTKDILLDEPGIKLRKGKSYDIKVKSKWKGVWHASGKYAGEQRLKLAGGSTGLVNWEYETNSLQIQVR